MHRLDDGDLTCVRQIAPMSTRSDSHAGPPRRFPNHDYPHQELTGKVIAASFVVYRTFGYGFLESVYRRALAVELRYHGVNVAQEVPYELFHRGISVGVYKADLVVESIVIVETKTGAFLDPKAPEQLLNCMSAARLTLGLLLYFGPGGVRIKRVIKTDDGQVTYV